MNSGKSRKLAYGINLLVILFATLVVLGIVNWLATKHYKRWDFGKPSAEALSDQTINVLKNLNKDVALTYFYTYSASDEDEESVDTWRDLLERYKALSKHFGYEMIDYAKNPQRVSNFFENTKKLTLEKNSSVLKSGEYVEKLPENTESALTSAIIKVTSGQMRTVCFTEGHGEHDPDVSGAGGYYKAADGLKKENFNVKRINILKDGVPSACNVVVIAGPVLAFKPEETALLEKWLDDSGKMMAMLDATGYTGLESMLNNYMIVPEDDVLKTEKSAAVGTDPFMVMADIYSSVSPITEPLSQVGVLVGNQVRAIPTYFYEARSLKLKEDILNEVKPEELIKTGDNVRVLPSKDAPLAARYRSFRTESGSKPAAQGSGAPLGEVGSQLVAATSYKVTEFEAVKATSEIPLAPKPKKTARIVIFGDSDFAADGYIEQAPNGDIFLNSIAWLAEEEQSIGIRPKQNKFIPIHFAGGRNWLILTGVLLIVPLVMFINGIIVWREKKRL